MRIDVAVAGLIGLALATPAYGGDQTRAKSPNVLFIAIDDLNDWVGCMGGHPQTRTPNIDRLAKSGVLFTNAYCAAPSCNPSRSAILSGLPPSRSGLYQNPQHLRDVMPNAELLPRFFSRHGYWSAGSGKILHYIIDPRTWDDYFPEKDKDDPFPRTFDPKERPVNLPLGGPWQYVDTDWAALDVTDEGLGGDWLVTKWIGEQLQLAHDKPFFLACGIYRPHEPWFVPTGYFEPFPLANIAPGPGYKPADVDDLPPSGQKLAQNRYFEHIQKHGQWKQAIQAYLASIYYADAMVGRVLDALEISPHAANTIVVLFSDHGWHLGEKEHWQKYTGWRIGCACRSLSASPRGHPAYGKERSRGRSAPGRSALQICSALSPSYAGSPPSLTCNRTASLLYSAIRVRSGRMQRSLTLIIPRATRSVPSAGAISTIAMATRSCMTSRPIPLNGRISPLPRCMPRSLLGCGLRAQGDGTGP